MEQSANGKAGSRVQEARLVENVIYRNLAYTRRKTQPYIRVSVNEFPRVTQLIDSINEPLAALARRGQMPFVFGGCLRDTLLDRSYKDVDIFCAGPFFKIKDMHDIGFKAGTAVSSFYYEKYIPIEIPDQDRCLGMTWGHNTFDIWHLFSTQQSYNECYGPQTVLNIVPTSMEAIYYDVYNKDLVMIPDYVDLLKSGMFHTINNDSKALPSRIERYISEGFTPFKKET